MLPTVFLAGKHHGKNKAQNVPTMFLAGKRSCVRKQATSSSMLSTSAVCEYEVEKLKLVLGEKNLSLLLTNSYRENLLQ